MSYYGSDTLIRKEVKERGFWESESLSDQQCVQVCRSVTYAESQICKTFLLIYANECLLAI